MQSKTIVAIAVFVFALVFGINIVHGQLDLNDTNTNMRLSIHEHAMHSLQLIKSFSMLSEQCGDTLRTGDNSITQQCEHLMASIDNHLTTAFNESKADIDKIMGLVK